MSIKLTVLESSLAAWEAHLERWRGCTACPPLAVSQGEPTSIGAIAQKHVFARGTLPCDVLFIGEGPGKTEDALGMPFVGRSGALLGEWISSSFHVCNIASAMEGQVRNSLTYAITNVVLCRPCASPGAPNRPPAHAETAACRPRLLEFILKVARPRALVLVGAVARTHSPEWSGLPRLELRHPAWALRQGGSGCPASNAEVEKLTEFLNKEIRNGKAT